MTDEIDSDSSTDISGHAVSQVSLWHSLRLYPSFRVLMGSTLATNSGFWMWIVASGWLALLLTDSPFFVGLAGFIGGIPTLIFGLFAGVLIDRFPRRTVLMSAQAVVMTASVTLSTLLFLDVLEPWHLLTLAFINGTAMCVIFPARNAMVANLVPSHHLANAIALNSAGQNATRVIGPALAGPFIAILGVDGTFAVCAGLQLLAFFITMQLPHSEASGGPGMRLLQSLGDGVRTVWSSEYLTGMIVLAAIPTLFLMPYINMMSVFARDVLSIGSTGLGILMAVNGFGGVCGSLAVAASRRLIETRNILIYSGLGFGAILFLFTLTSVPWLAGILIFFAGCASALFLAINSTLIQLNVEDRMRGRVTGIYVLTWGLLPVGTLPVGAAADIVGTPVAVASMSVLAMLVIILVAFRFPAVRYHEAPEVRASRDASLQKQQA